MTKSRRGLKIDNKLERGRLQYRQVGGRLALENAAGVDAYEAIGISNAGAVAHEAAGVGEIPGEIDRRYRVTLRQPDQLLALALQERIVCDQKPTHPLLGEALEGRFNFVCGTGIKNADLEPELAPGVFDVLHFGRGARIVRINQHSDGACCGHELPQQLEPLRAERTEKQVDPRYIAAGPRAGRNALSFFYYPGHGVANPETQINYLIPVDVIEAEDDKVWFESFQQNAIIDLLSKQAPNATHYVVFDACRNELNMAGTAAKALGTDKGFVPVTDTAGLLIAYATAPRKTASDVGDDGGPYAKALSEELTKPGIEAVTMFRNVQLRVKQTIGQDPWLSFPSLPAVYFAGTKPTENVELTFWAAVKDSTSPAVLNTYLQRYPNGEFASIARALIERYERQLKAEQAAREEERKRQEEVRKSAELKRLEEERLVREAALSQERQRTEQMKNLAEVKRVEEQQRAEIVARTEELLKAQDAVLGGSGSRQGSR